MKSIKKTLSLILALAMLLTLPPVAALAEDLSDAAEMLRISDEFEAAHPNGAFSLSEMAVETHEYSGRIVTEVVRHGGAAGRVDVTLKAIDVSAKIGQDYRLSVPKLLLPSTVEGSGSETLLEGDGTRMNDVPIEQAVTTEDNIEANIEWAQVDPPSEAGKNTHGTGLRAAREQATGAQSDRNKFAYSDEQKSEMVNTAQLAAEDYYTQVPGTEFTLSFGDGERTKSIYIDIINDELREADEQFILVITGVTDGGNIGMQRDTSVNILDDEPYEKPVIGFSSYVYTAGSESATVTLVRSAGLNYYAGGQIFTVNGSAQPGIDYTPLNQDFLFLPGQTQMQVTIPIINDSPDAEKIFYVRVEPNESCSVSGDEVVQVLIPKAAQPPAGAMAAMASDVTEPPQGLSLMAGDAGVTLGAASIKFNGTDSSNFKNVGSSQGNFFVHHSGWYEVNIQHNSISSGVQLNKSLYKSMLNSIKADMTLYKLRKDNHFDVWIDAEYKSDVIQKVNPPFKSVVKGLPTYVASKNLIYGRSGGYDNRITNVPVFDRSSTNPQMMKTVSDIGREDPFHLSLSIRNGKGDYGAMRLYSVTFNFRHFGFQIYPSKDTLYTFDYSKDQKDYEAVTGPVGEIEITDGLGRKVNDFYTSEKHIFNVTAKNVVPGYYLKELWFYNNTDINNARHYVYSMDNTSGHLVVDNEFLNEISGFTLTTSSYEALLVQPVFARNNAELTVRLADGDKGKGELLGVEFDAPDDQPYKSRGGVPFHVGDKVVLTGVGKGGQAVTGYYITHNDGGRTVTETSDEHGAGIITLTLAEKTEVTPIFGERAFSVKPDPDADPNLRGSFSLNYNLNKEPPDKITFTEDGRLPGVVSGEPVEIMVIPPSGYTTQWANRTGDTNGNGVLDDSEKRDENGKLYPMYDYNGDGLLDAEYASPLFGDFLSYRVNQPRNLFYYNFVPLSGQIVHSGAVTGYVYTREYDIRNGFTMDKNGYKLVPVTGATVKMGGTYNSANPDAQIGYATSTENTGKFTFNVSNVIKNAYYFLSIAQASSSFFVDKINPSSSGDPYIIPTFTSMKPVSIDAYPTNKNDKTVAGSVIMVEKDKKVNFVLLTQSLENNVKVAKVDFRVYSKNGTLKSSHIASASMNRAEFTANLHDVFAQNDRLVVQLIDQTGGKSLEYNTGFEFRPPLPATSVLPSFAADVSKSVPLFDTVMGALDLGLTHFENVYMKGEDIIVTLGYEHAFDEYNKVLKETGGKEEDEEKTKVTVEDLEKTKEKINEINKDKKNKKTDTNVKTKSTVTNNLSVNVSLEMKLKYDSKRPASAGSPYYFSHLKLMVTLTDSLEFKIAVTIPVGLTVTTKLEIGGSVTGYIKITPITTIGATEPLRVYADEYGNYPYYDSDMFKDVNYKFNVNGGLILKPYISLTISGDYSVATLDVNGRADFTLIFASDRSNSGTVKLSGHIKASALGITIYEKGLEGGTINLFGNSKARMMLMDEEPPLEQSTFAPISRNYLDNRSDWLGSEPPFTTPGDASLLAEGMLLGGVYPDPDIQLMRIDEDSILMVFVDDNPDRSDYNRAALYYSISHDNGATYSEPALLADDGTLDSSPRLVDLGDKILCLYSSLKEEIADDVLLSMEEMLEANELEMRFFNKADGVFEDAPIDVTKNTGQPNPENEGGLIGDYTSNEHGSAVYDLVSGKVLMIYTKSDFTSDAGRTFSAGDLFDTQKSYSAVAYRIYDAITGRFLMYEEIGYPDGVDTDSEKAEWDALWYGQKFLDAEIVDKSLPGGGIEDPLVLDLTTALKGQTAYIAYTVDMDSDLSTAEDRDIYLASYSFNDNTFTKPIKASDIYAGEPPRADGRPQLVAYENAVYLFYAADTEVHYVKADVLFDPGEIVDTSHLGEEGTGEADVVTKESLPNHPHVALKADEAQHHPGEDYRVLTGDDGKLYLIWTEATLRYADGIEPGSQEALDPRNAYHEDQIYAAVYYEDYEANFADEHDGEDTHTDLLYMSDPDVEYGRWSGKVQLTFGPGSYNDVAADVMADGRILLAARKNDLTYSEEHGLLISDPDTARLVAMTLTPAIRIEPGEDAITFNPSYPVEGETVRITAGFTNHGLMPLIRPVVEFYALIDGVEQPIGSATAGRALYGGETGSAGIEWTVPADIQNLAIVAMLKSEANDEIYAEFDTGFPYSVDLEHNLFRLTHIARNGYQVSAEVLHTGNEPLSDAEIVINLLDRNDYIIRELKRSPIADEVDADGLLVLRESFELKNADLEPMDSVMGGSASVELRIEKNGALLYRHMGTVVKDISALYGEQINAAESVVLSASSLSLAPGNQRSVTTSVSPAETTENFRIVYRSSNPSVASVSESGVVTAHTFGNAVITAYAVPDIELHTLTLDGYSLSGDVLDNLSPEDCRSGSVQVAVLSDSSSDNNSTPVLPDASGTDTATLTIKAAMSGSGKATASVSHQQIANAVRGGLGRNPEDAMDIRINVDAPDGAQTVETVITPAAVREMVDNRFGMTIVTPVARINFDERALSSILEQSDGDIAITASLVDKSTLPNSVLAAVDEHPVFDFSVTSGSRRISQFNGNVTVSVPYTPADSEDPNSIVIYHITAEGTVEIVKNCRYDPDTGTVTFVTSHFSYFAVGYNPVQFNDVAKGAWYNKAVSFIAAREITKGTGNGNYSPTAKLTRAEFLVLMMRAYGIAPDNNPTDNFSDAGDSYYTGYLAAAKRLGISAGAGNNLYAPGKEITRQEMFTLLYNALKVIRQLPQGDSGKTLDQFTDAGQIASWAKEAMTLLVKTGTIGGNNGLLTPTGTTTRAEMAQVLYNLLRR